jgi:hypothetical protein
LHPFVHGILFFYGLDFHHLPPNSILHLASFIIACEAFLRIELHFRLWLKTFGIKPKSSGSELAECGGAMISKNQKADWFYVTEPLADGRAEVPAFSAGPPKRLASWRRKGMDWGNPEEVMEL